MAVPGTGFDRALRTAADLDAFGDEVMEQRPITIVAAAMPKPCQSQTERRGRHMSEHVKARHTVETYLVDDTPTLIEITSADWSISGRGAHREYRLKD